MTSEDSTEVFRDNILCEQDANVSRIETERREEDDKDDEQHDEDYQQQHDEEPAYTPNVPVYNPYDALRRCTLCLSEEIVYIGKANEKECLDGVCCPEDDMNLYRCKKCEKFICADCIDYGMFQKM